MSVHRHVFLRGSFWLTFFQSLGKKSSGSAIDQPPFKRSMTLPLSALTLAHLKFVLLPGSGVLAPVMAQR